MSPADGPLEEHPEKAADELAQIPLALPADQGTAAGADVNEPPEPAPVPEALPVPKPPRPGFWESVLWCIGFLVITNGILAGVLIIGMTLHVTVAPHGKDLLAKIQRHEEPGPSDMKWEWAAAMFACETVAVAFAWLVVRLVVGRGWHRRLALRRPSVSHLFIAILGFPALLYASEAIHALANKVLPSLGYNQQLTNIFSEWPWWFGVFVVGVCPALAEELFCRGFLGRGLVGRYGPLVGVLLTSFFFGVLHVDPPHALATFVMGLALHFSYLMARSLWVPILLHFLNNTLAVLAASIPGLQDNTDETVPYLVGLLAASLVLAAAAGWALHRSRVRFITSDGRAWQPDYPGVEYPPARASCVVIRPWPGWLPSCATLLALAALVAVQVYASGAFRALD